MKGLILTNAFSYRKSAKYQCESLIKEFSLLGVQVDHMTNQELLVYIGSNNVFCNPILNEYNFIIYLDKDKYISFMLEKLHIRIFNSAQSIEICDDKMLTHIVLANNGIKMPKTISYPLCYEFNNVLTYLDKINNVLTYPFIVKENYGSLGQQVYLINNEEELIKIEDQLRYKPHIFQEFISESFGVDCRLIVIGNEIVASMKRTNSTSFKANIAQGGIGESYYPSENMKNIAINVSKIIGLDYCAIDFVIDKDNNPVLIEVNSNAYFTEIEKVTGVNIAKIYASYILKKLEKESR